MSESTGIQQNVERGVRSVDQIEADLTMAQLVAKYRADVQTFLNLPFCQDPCFSERSQSAWENLQSFSREQLSVMVDHFSTYVSVCQEVAELYSGEFRNKQAVWTYLKRKQLVPSSTLLNEIGESDVIEIFDLRGNQIFRNIQYFKVSSYTFEDLMHFPVNMLYRRDPTVSALLMAEVGKILSGEIGSEHRSQIPIHEVSEIRSTKLYSSLAEQRILAPLLDAQGRVAALLATVDIQILSVGNTLPPMRPELRL